MRILRAVVMLALVLGVSAAHAQTSPRATTNRAVVITSGTTFQTILASGVYRSITIQNNNTNTDSCWIYVGAGTATIGKSIVLSPGLAYTRYFPFIPSDIIQGTCANTSDTIYVDTQ